MCCFQPHFAPCAGRARLAPSRHGGRAVAFASKLGETTTPSPLRCLIFTANSTAIKDSGETRESHFVSSRSHAVKIPSHDSASKPEKSGKPHVNTRSQIGSDFISVTPTDDGVKAQFETLAKPLKTITFLDI